MKISLMALSASATATATPSEFTRYVLPSPSKPSGGMTGMMPCASSVWSSSTSTRSTLPVNRWSTPWMMPMRMRDDGVGAGGAQVVGRKAFENLVRQPVRGGQRELERGRVRDARAVEVGRL